MREEKKKKRETEKREGARAKSVAAQQAEGRQVLKGRESSGPGSLRESDLDPKGSRASKACVVCLYYH